MFIDITLEVTPELIGAAQGNEKKALEGHLGTHFDVMNKAFPLEYIERKAVVFDVRHVGCGEITVADIDIDLAQANMFVAFYTGFIDSEGYGGKGYFSEHPQVSNELIDALLLRKISIIGVDFAGLRRGVEHTPKDQYCADKGVFIVENLCNLGNVLQGNRSLHFIANTYPVRYSDTTGLPCRVVAKIEGIIKNTNDRETQ